MDIGDHIFTLQQLTEQIVDEQVRKALEQVATILSAQYEGLPADEEETK